MNNPLARLASPTAAVGSRLMHCLPCIVAGLFLGPSFSGQSRAVAGPPPTAAPEQRGPVRFQDELRPLLAVNCLACHNSKTKEGGIIAEAFSQIEKAMLRPADPCRTRLSTSLLLLHGPRASRSCISTYGMPLAASKAPPPPPTATTGIPAALTRRAIDSVSNDAMIPWPGQSSKSCPLAAFSTLAPWLKHA